MDEVFLLSHVSNTDDWKLIGVYRVEADAQTAIGRLRNKPGFVTLPDGFHIDRYELNRDHWTDGFVTA